MIKTAFEISSRILAIGEIDFKEIKTRAKELAINLKIDLQKSNRIIPTFESKEYNCENSQTIKINKSNENLKDVDNPEYNLIHSENFIIDNCRVIKVWSSAFDNGVFEKIKLISIELQLDGVSTYYSVNKEVSIEQNSFIESCPLLPSIPEYLEIYTKDVESDVVNVIFKSN